MKVLLILLGLIVVALGLATWRYREQATTARTRADSLAFADSVLRARNTTLAAALDTQLATASRQKEAELTALRSTYDQLVRDMQAEIAQGQVQITDFADQLILPFCGGEQEVRDMIGFSSSEVPGLGADVGTCGFNGAFTTEDDKINLNCANNTTIFQTLQIALEGLVFFQAYDPVFEEADVEGWRRDRKTQVTALHMAFVDTDLVRGLDQPKSSPEEIVGRALDGLEAGLDEVIADAATQAVKQGLSGTTASAMPARH